MITVLLIGLGTFFITEFIKQFLATFVVSPVPPPAKYLIAILASAGMVLLFDVELGGRAVGVWLAGSGMAAFIHRIHRAFGAWGDVARATVISAARGRVR